MATKRKKIVIIIVIGGIVVVTLAVLLGIGLRDAVKEGERTSAAHLPDTYTLPSEDSGLIAKKNISNIKVEVTANSKDRGPISFIIFDQKYHLVIYKIDMIKDTILKNIFHTDIKNVEATIGVTYGLINIGDVFSFKRLSKPSSPVSDIYLTLSGDSLSNIITNDTVISYHLLCKNFSIRYAENDPIDIFVGGQEGSFGTTSIIPMNLLFLKRGAAVYLLFMTPTEPNATVVPDLLYNVIMER